MLILFMYDCETAVSRIYNLTLFGLGGETAKMHLKAYVNASIPSPIEIMVFLVLGWLFVLIGDYKEMWLEKNRVEQHQ